MSEVSVAGCETPGGSVELPTRGGPDLAHSPKSLASGARAQSPTTLLRPAHGPPRPRGPLRPRASARDLRYRAWVLVRWLTRLSLALCVAGSASSARADSLSIDLQANPERGFQVVQELSYEAIVAATDGYHADLRLRVALHNASNREQDAVLSLALPRESQIHGLQVARDGAWTPGKSTGIAPEPGRREPGSVYVRPLAPTAAGDPPAAELVVFSLEPDATTQVELHIKAPTRLRGDRWELELPGRGQERTGLSPERRVLVQHASPGRPAPRFWVDAIANGGAPFLITQPDDPTIVSWPMGQVAKAGARPLDARLEVMPDDVGDARSGGRFRLYLRMQPTAAPRPDHVVVVLDRSRSTDPRMHREALAAMAGLFDSLPANLTFDAISFARQAKPLLPDGAAFPGVHDKAARDRVAALLDAGSREQGTDLAAAIELAGQRITTRRARRPLVLVLTDGMLPLGAGAGPIGQVLADSLGDKALRPDIVFVVDEPMLARTGITPEHPVAALAAGLGARITLTTLAHLAGEDPSANLLTAPGVLHDLDIKLPRQAVLEDSIPTGLVAGNALVLDGLYSGTPPAVQIRGRIGARREQLSPRPTRMPAPPAALVASTREAGTERSAADGFSLPPWYTRKYQRSARLGITWANRSGGDDPGRLDERIFKRYLGTRVFPRARACYNLALARNQTIGGRVLFEFEVGKGEVMRASIDPTGMTSNDLVFERCLVEAAWMLDMPAGKSDDQIYRVRYPLVFNPPRTGKPALTDDPLGPGTVELLLQHGLSGTPRPPAPAQ